MKTSIKLASAVVLLAGARLGWAQFQPPTFDQLDKDGNGSLSKEEVAGFFAQFAGGPGGGQAGGRAIDPDRIFARWDANGDGKVSKEEFENRPRGRRGGGGQPQGQGK